MKILMSLIFYPRGGSAQVARYLSRALIELGHEVRLITGTYPGGASTAFRVTMRRGRS